MECNISVNSRYEKSVFLLTLCSTFMLIQFGIFDLFWILQVAVIIVQMLISQKLLITRDKLIRVLYITWILSTLLCFASSIPMSYKENAIIAITFLIPTFFSVSVYSKYIRQEHFVGCLKKALVISCTIQLIWCFAQFILYKGSHIDLNQVLFKDILHMVENTSQYKLGVYHPSGMCWHSAFIAPIAIFAFVLSESYIIKCLAFIDAVICNNATALIGICICLMLTAVFSLFDFLSRSNKSTRKKTALAFIVILVIIIPVCIYTDAISTVGQKIIDIYERSTGIVYDGGSANAHIRYFTAYPNVVKNESVTQFLFGYGTGNSGYPISKLFGQYANLKSWVVETDIMNQMYSSGIIGFFLFYGLLLYIAIKGLKIDKRYFILMVSIILAGITYNIQFDWVIFIEFMMYFCVKNKVNLFRIGEYK